MSKIQFTPNASGTGTFNIVSPNSNSDFTLTLPESSGTILFQEGTIPFDAGSVSTPSITTTGDLNTGIWFPAADTMAASTGGTERMRIDSSGNVGIGTSAPSNVLTVLSATQYKGYTLKNATNTVAELIGFAVGNDTGGLKLYSAGVAQAQILAGGTSFFNGGNVGIGTTSPATGALMQVGDGTDAISMTGTDPIFAVKGASFGTGLVVKRDGYAEAGIQSANQGIFGTYTNHPVMFKLNNAEAMRIETNGVIGIGTAGPNASTKVHIVGSSTDANSALDLQKGSGTTTTSQVFVRFFAPTATGSITANGVSAATFTAYSDRRLKENIEMLPCQLENICKLKPSEFDFIGYPEGEGHQIGFIAQDMQEVYPDVVSEGKNGMLQISGWSKTEARLVKAIQEQQKIIETLEARVASLEAN